VWLEPCTDARPRHALMTVSRPTGKNQSACCRDCLVLAPNRPAKSRERAVRLFGLRAVSGPGQGRCLAYHDVNVGARMLVRDGALAIERVGGHHPSRA
jgi:hypothetical protein